VSQLAMLDIVPLRGCSVVNMQAYWPAINRTWLRSADLTC